jgi:pSer/pThr/pTyr-binding forkhead associated (FHA) protein
MSRIVIRDPKGDERIHELVDPITTIGRGSSNTIQCRDREASRQHCRIEKTDTGYRMVDNRSRNGTILNNEKTEMQNLRPGDVITIGEFRLQFDPPEGAEDEDFAATIEVAPLTEKEAASPRSSGSGGGDGKPKYVLEVYEGRQAGQRFELANDALTIGRNSANIFKIDDESGSSFHAEITKEPTGYFLTDLGSTNGTRVAGEKVVKTRLGPGAEIQIGTTKMRFMNIGAPAEEDEVFGTVVLDTERLERELAEDEMQARSAFVRRIAMGVAALVLVGGLVFAGKWLLGMAGGEDNHEVVGNVLDNPSFSGPPDERGAPSGWRTQAGRNTPWSVKPLDSVSGKLEGEAKALVVAREGEARIDEYTQCRAREMINVQAGSSYRLGGWLKAPDAQGAYGFRVRWLARRGDERSSVEQAFVTGSQTAWRRKDGVFTPPKWATRAEVSCFAIGNRGSVYFDDVYFAPVSRVVPTDTAISFKQLKAEFSPSGVFTVMSGTETAVRKGELFFMGQDDAATSQSYADAEEPRSDRNSSTFTGLIPEFASTGLIRYNQTWRPGDLGLVAEYDLSADSPVSVERAGVRFTVGGAFGYGKVEVFGADGLLSETSGEIEGAREVVFTVDKDTRLAVGIGKGHKLRIEPRGDEKYVEVTLAGSTTLSRRAARLSVEFNEGSRVETLAIEGLRDRLRTAERSKDLAATYKACQAIIKVADRFPGDAAEAKRKIALLKKEADADFEKAEGLVERARGAVGAERTFQVLRRELEKSIRELKRKYTGTPFEQRVVDLEVQMAELDELAASVKDEEAAQKLLLQIRPLIENNPELALRLLFALQAKYPKSKAWATAKAEGLVEKCKAIIARDKERDEVFDRLKARTRNLLLNEMYQEALNVIRADRGYQKFRDDPDIKPFVEEIEELAREKRNAGGAAE